MEDLLQWLGACLLSIMRASLHPCVRRAGAGRQAGGKERGDKAKGKENQSGRSLLSIGKFSENTITKLIHYIDCCGIFVHCVRVYFCDWLNKKLNGQ